MNGFGSTTYGEHERNRMLLRMCGAFGISVRHEPKSTDWCLDASGPPFWYVWYGSWLSKTLGAARMTKSADPPDMRVDLPPFF